MKNLVAFFTEQVALVLFIVTFFPFAAQASPITVDGQYNDFFAPMYRAGNLEKDQLPNAYFRYDSNTGAVFVVVFETEEALVQLSGSPDNPRSRLHIVPTARRPYRLMRASAPFVFEGKGEWSERLASRPLLARLTAPQFGQQSVFRLPTGI